jgi:O-antigen/teichoic acid export membrane protein
MAFMSIPASSSSKVDMSAGSLRLGLSYTTPIVAVLIVAPNAILSIIGPEYTSASATLLILSVGILPSIVVSNFIAKLNNARRYRELVLVGSVQLCAFLSLFFALVPTLNSEGASYSITISSIVASVLILVWLDRTSRKHIFTSTVSIAGGSGVGILLAYVINLHPLASAVIAAVVALSTLFKLGNTSVKETKHLIQTLRKR